MVRPGAGRLGRGRGLGIAVHRGGCLKPIPHIFVRKLGRHVTALRPIRGPARAHAPAPVPLQGLRLLHLRVDPGDADGGRRDVWLALRHRTPSGTNSLLLLTHRGSPGGLGGAAPRRGVQRQGRGRRHAAAGEPPVAQASGEGRSRGRLWHGCPHCGADPDASRPVVHQRDLPPVVPLQVLPRGAHPSPPTRQRSQVDPDEGEGAWDGRAAKTQTGTGEASQDGGR
mmetsp:Transcript_37827/g.73881  ORF Transcript_37827/g.73881 Transcript_37827/m.73881 type:complete len:226 (-) Transcript_37827:204-881(-)